MAKRDQRNIVKAEIESIPGAKFIRFDRNKHGPIAVYECMGMEWEYGFDGSPKGTYTPAKTRKGILHSMLGKAAPRGLTNEQIYKVVRA